LQRYLVKKSSRFKVQCSHLTAHRLEIPPAPLYQRGAASWRTGEWRTKGDERGILKPLPSLLSPTGRGKVRGNNL